MFDAAQEPKRLVVIRGADHNDYELLAGPQLIGEVTRFVTEALTRWWIAATEASPDLAEDCRRGDRKATLPMQK